MMFVTYPRDLFPSYTMEPRYYDYGNGCMFGVPSARQLYPNYYYNVQQPNPRILNGRCSYPSTEFYNERPVSYRPSRRPVRTIRQFNPAVMNNWSESPPICRGGENAAPGNIVANQCDLECNDWPENSRMNSNIPRSRKKNLDFPIITKESSTSVPGEEDLSNAISTSVPGEEELSNAIGQCKLENRQAENTSTVCTNSLSDRSTHELPGELPQDHANDVIEYSNSNKNSDQKESLKNNKTAINDANTLLESSEEETLSVEKPNESSGVNHTLDQVKNILKETQKLKEQADQFSGTRNDKQFLYLEEMLTRMLLKLDGIDSQGKEDIRLVRREAVKTVQASLDVLDNKVQRAQGRAQGCQLKPENAQKSVDTSENTYTGVNTSDTEGKALDCSENEQSDDTSELDQKGIDHS